MKKLLAVPLALLSACGGGGSTDFPPPPTGPGPLVPDTGALVDGAVWQLNRPIDVRFDRPIDFTSVNLSSFAVEMLPGGVFPLGTYGPGSDPVTGAVDEAVVRFQPACPTEAGPPAAGLQPGTEYRLIVGGSDTTSVPLRAADGTELATTLEVTFETPLSTDPLVLFFDPQPGPPVPVIRGRGAIPLDDDAATRIELGAFQPATVQLEDSGFGGLAVAAASLPLVANGLPLNHHIVFENRVSLVVEFDQPISPAPANVERVGLDYLDGSWKPIPCETELLVTCGRRGSAVRVTPHGTLPSALPLRLRLDDGFSDLVGDAQLVPWTELLPVEGTTDQGPRGARVDALLEHFTVGGDEPGSMEDTTSDLGAPRAFWGSGILAAIDTPGNLSRARSRWFAVGLAGVDAGLPPVAPALSFAGTDDMGRVERNGASVLVEPAVIGPVAVTAVEPYAMRMAPADLAEPTGLYMAQPALLVGVRARVRPSPTPGASFARQVLGAGFTNGEARLWFGSGCYIPGINPDCAPWDLSSLFPPPPNTTVEISPQSFEVYNFLQRDLFMPDHRIGFLFQGTRRGPDGSPDPTSASAWVPDPAQLAGTPWEYLRFEVEFDLDVSGDGYDPAEGGPRLDFVKVPIDLRR